MENVRGKPCFFPFIFFLLCTKQACWEIQFQVNLAMAAMVSERKYFPLTKRTWQGDSVVLCFLLKVLQFNILHLDLWSGWINFGVRCKVEVEFRWHVNEKLFQHHLVKRPSFPPWITFTLLPKVKRPYLCRSMSEVSLLFYWSTCLSLYLYHTVLISVAL